MSDELARAIDREADYLDGIQVRGVAGRLRDIAEQLRGQGEVPPPAAPPTPETAPPPAVRECAYCPAPAYKDSLFCLHCYVEQKL